MSLRGHLDKPAAVNILEFPLRKCVIDTQIGDVKKEALRRRVCMGVNVEVDNFSMSDYLAASLNITLTYTLVDICLQSAHRDVETHTHTGSSIQNKKL